MIFEKEADLVREKRAIDLFTSTFSCTYKKLDPLDIDFKIFDKDEKLIAYAEVKGRIRTLYDAYPLPISAKKVVKLMDKRLNPVIVWSCEDGIIYGQVNRLTGEIKLDDSELMIFYSKQKPLKYIRFV